jgi:hypothetical protein
MSTMGVRRDKGGETTDCAGDWCLVEFNGIAGFVGAADLGNDAPSEARPREGLKIAQEDALGSRADQLPPVRRRALLREVKTRTCSCFLPSRHQPPLHAALTESAQRPGRNAPSLPHKQRARALLPWLMTYGILIACRFEFLPLGLREMPAPPRKYRLGAQQRRALQLLAGTPFGATEATMSANGFTRKTFVPLIRAGLATTQRQNVKAGSRSLGRQDYCGRPAGARDVALRGARLNLSLRE